MNDKAENYINKQNTLQKEMCSKLREMILTNFPKIEETIMSEGLWYEGKFYIASFADHVKLGVGVTGLSNEELKNFEGKGKSLRHIKFFSPEDIREEKLLKLMQLVYTKAKCSHKVNWKS